MAIGSRHVSKTDNSCGDRRNAGRLGFDYVRDWRDAPTHGLTAAAVTPMRRRRVGDDFRKDLLARSYILVATSALRLALVSESKARWYEHSTSSLR